VIALRESLAFIQGLPQSWMRCPDTVARPSPPEYLAGPPAALWQYIGGSVVLPFPLDLFDG
jgi:hypothetical protein